MKVNRLRDPSFRLQPPPQDIESCEEVVLEAGDVLYFPSGMWHRVECLEDSVSINISLMPALWADLVCDSLRHMLYVDIAGLEQCGPSDVV